VKHVRQLDALRGVAILLVIAAHWLGRHYLGDAWLNGHVGVHLFFVLSGFLITGILLDARADAERAGGGRAGVLSAFYARRFLRIFPLFYATLTVAYLVGFGAVRATAAWHFAYASNVLFFLRGSWLGVVSHLWSLAVEEQFYLVWPILILFLPRRWLAPVLAAVIVLASVYRLTGQAAFGWNDVQTEVLPFGCLDSLGCGALLAWGERNSPKATLRLTTVGLYFLLPMYVLTRGLAEIVPVMGSVARPLLAPFLAAIVAAGARSQSTLLTFRPLRFLGKISYALYLFHNFVPVVTVSLLTNRLAMHLPRATMIAIDSFVLAGAATASWFVFESPINSLKRYVPYMRQRARPAVVADVPMAPSSASAGEEDNPRAAPCSIRGR
jgi:peptidoglycan/LPS O-acetylase OafA/YrhL